MVLVAVPHATGVPGHCGDPRLWGLSRGAAHGWRPQGVLHPHDTIHPQGRAAHLHCPVTHFPGHCGARGGHHCSWSPGTVCISGWAVFVGRSAVCVRKSCSAHHSRLPPVQATSTLANECILHARTLGIKVSAVCGNVSSHGAFRLHSHPSFRRPRFDTTGCCCPSPSLPSCPLFAQCVYTDHSLFGFTDPGRLVLSHPSPPPLLAQYGATGFRVCTLLPPVVACTSTRCCSSRWRTWTTQYVYPGQGACCIDPVQCGGGEGWGGRGGKSRVSLAGMTPPVA